MPLGILTLPALLVSLLALSPDTPLELDPMRILDPTDATQAQGWRPIHDGVMGGVSRGQVVPGEQSTRFEGHVSLDNNGGFASFRIGRRLPDLSGYDGLRLSVRGDGQVFKLSLRVDGAWDGVSWQAPFATRAGEWTTVELPFEDLVPTWRGRLVRDAPAFDASAIQQVGLMIADKQEGPFALELASVDAWRARAPDGGETGTRVAARARTAACAAALDEGASIEDAFRGQERLLVIASPDELDAEASLQLGDLFAARSELDARELRIVSLMGERGGRLAGRTLSRAQVETLRDRWELPAGTWQVVLVGKDGELKQRWSTPVEPAVVFALIDGMPMRRRELDERS